ncbi:MAG: Xaa-Pro dipeptidyl-peptidase [Planctomycetes bacterium]|nr:Xaa-Pro dipeptidyl-peptidase [Planctomycetota bacterium]
MIDPAVRVAHGPGPSLSAWTIALSFALSPSVSAQDTAAAAVPRFEDGEAQVVEAFADAKEWIREQLWVETSFDSDGDGKPDRMHVDVTRPKQTASAGLKVPVIYETSPYFAGTGGTDAAYFWNPSHALGATPPVRGEMPPIPFRTPRGMIANSEVQTWVPRGFAVVHSSSPGTGLSQGCPTVGGDNESLAPKAVIDWLNGRAKGFTSATGGEPVLADWCTGKVGMIGTSYNGTLPLAAATTGVEGLEAIVPIAPNTSYYHYYRSHGLVRHPGGYMGEDIDVLYDFINSGDPARREYCNEKVRAEQLQKHQDRITGDYNEFWAGRDYLNDLAPMKAATLMSHAFNDWNVMPEHSVRIHAALKQKGVPCIAFFHQGGHGGPPPLTLVNRWFTRFLYGIENGVEGGPRSWIVREDAARSKPTAYPDYPHPDAAPVRLHLGRSGTALGTLARAESKGQGQETLVDDAAITGAELASAERSDHRLLYATEALTSAVHLSGTARLHVRLACDRPATNFSVWLVSLPYTGGRKITDDVITRGWADPQNRGSLTTSAPLVPGEFVEFAFDLQPDDQVIQPGERIGLMLFASDRDFTLWPPAGTKVTVDLDATWIELPLVGGEAAFAAAIAAKR